MPVCNLLFVYGTLMPDAVGELGQHERDELLRTGRHVGAAYLPGQLLDLGAYPGLHSFQIDPNGEVGHAGSRVFGELYELIDPAETFQWLDPYEGIDSSLAVDEYRRVVLTVTRVGPPPEDVKAWVYVLTDIDQTLVLDGCQRWNRFE